MTDSTAVSPMGTEMICGKQTANGKRCSRKPGHGTGLDHGPCSQHTEASAISLAEIKKEFLRLLPDPLLTVCNIAAEMGIPVRNLYGMRSSDPIFANQWIDIMTGKENYRTEIIEESMFKRAASETTQNPAESIFWLKNRAPQRWKDKVQQEHTGADGKALMPIDALRAFLAPSEEDQKALPKANDSEIIIEETK